MAVSSSCGWVYDYDRTYQLTDADYNTSRSIDYAYDNVYNRTSVTDNSVVTNYSANSVNQYTAIGPAAPAYDANGNITWDGLNAYEYYCDNRLGFAATGSGFFSYSYDLLGRRIRRLDLLYSEFVEYVWDGEHIIAEYDSEGSLIRKYIYGPGIDNPVVMINADGGNETRYYYYTDALGSVRLMSNSNGQIVEGYSYDPFGRPTVNTTAGTDCDWLTPDGSTASASAIGNTYMFTARQWDSATGIYYYRFRDYHPALGRFLQPDPLGYIDGMNLYAYVGNNPVNWFDPWGLDKLVTDKEKVKILEDWKKWCEDPANRVNNDIWYHQCFTHAEENKKWFEMQGYKHWQAIDDWRWKWGGLFNHTILVIRPSSKDLRDDSYMFVLDSWLWDSVSSYEEFKRKWPGGEDLD